MKKIVKIIYILLVIITIFTLTTKVYAENCRACNGVGTRNGRECSVCVGSGIMPGSTSGTDKKETIEEIISGAETFIATGSYFKDEEKASTIKFESMQLVSDTIYNVLLVIGIIAAFIVGGILGIKFMTGGIEGQVEVKQALVPYIVGCAVVFGAFTIWKIVLTILL